MGFAGVPISKAGLADILIRLQEIAQEEGKNVVDLVKEATADTDSDPIGDSNLGALPPVQPPTPEAIDLAAQKLQSASAVFSLEFIRKLRQQHGAFFK